MRSTAIRPHLDDRIVECGRTGGHIRLEDFLAGIGQNVVCGASFAYADDFLFSLGSEKFLDPGFESRISRSHAC